MLFAAKCIIIIIMSESISQQEMHFEKECLYDIEWQVLRVGILSQNNDETNFTSVLRAEKAIARLTAYIERAETDRDKSLRLHRVSNHYAAVMFALKSDKTKTDIYEMVRVEQKRISDLRWSKEYRNAFLFCKKQIGWCWKHVKRDIENLNTASLVLIRKDMEKRIQTANRKERLGIGGMKYRPELRVFTQLLDEELEKRNGK